MNHPEEKRSFLPEILAAAGALSFSLLCILLKIHPARLIGAAFCHQIASRSPSPDFPFCYRCCGLFFGITWAILSRSIIKRDRKVFSAGEIALFFFTFVLFISDIANTSPYIRFQLYTDQPVARFLSAFPFGFSLAGIIMSAFSSLFAFSSNRHISVFTDLLFLCGSCILSWLMLFRMGSFGLILSGMLITPGSFFFILILYCILIKCIVLLKNKTCSGRSIFLLGCFSAFCQICVLGTIHTLFLHFESLA